MQTETKTYYKQSAEKTKMVLTTLQVKQNLPRAGKKICVALPTNMAKEKGVLKTVWITNTSEGDQKNYKIEMVYTA